MENSSKGEAEHDEQQPLERKPLRSLAPMLPAPLRKYVETQSADPTFVFVTPFRRPCSSSEQRPPQSSAPYNVRPFPNSPVPLKVTPISSVAFSGPPREGETSDDDYKPFANQKKPTPQPLKRTRQVGDSDADAGNIKRRHSVRRSLKKDHLASCRPSTSDGPRESVEKLMMVFDSLRRRILQLDEKEDAATSRRADLEAGTLMMRAGLRTNNLKKIIGPVPGVEVGDIFFFRIEMCIVGLHAPAMAGIDYIPAKHAGKADETLAVSVISSGGYDNDDDDPDVLVYSGQGGNSRHNEKHDQKLEKGNLALMNSMKRQNLIRVVRSAKDPFCNSGKIYIYDGVYRVEDSWMDKAKNGFSVFKYRLRREPGQPDGISVWKMTDKWKQNPATRGNKVILHDLSRKVENLPVCLVNDVKGEDEGPPGYFNYITGVKYYPRPLLQQQGCNCPGVCLPGDDKCSCTVPLNGGDLPYSSSGLLIKHVPMLYECSSNCRCSQNCRNRVSQKGVYLKFEVFWTGDRGWGLRSWDPIRAGTFVCEYAGEVVDDEETYYYTNRDGKLLQEDDEYAFHASWFGDKVLRWNLGAELLLEEEEEEASGRRRNVTATESFNKLLPAVISAKRSGNVARFLNHSCSPNLLWQPVRYDLHGPHIMFFAMEHVPPMTELTYDYGTRGAPPGIKGEFLFPRAACKLKPCLCGSTDCRGSF